MPDCEMSRHSNVSTYSDAFYSPNFAGFRGTPYAIVAATSPTVPQDVSGNAAALVRITDTGQPLVVDTLTNVFDYWDDPSDLAQTMYFTVQLSSTHVIIVDGYGEFMRLFKRDGEILTLVDSAQTDYLYSTGYLRVDDTHFILTDNTIGASDPQLEMWTVVNDTLYPIFYTSRDWDDWNNNARWLGWANGFLVEVAHNGGGGGLWFNTYSIGENYEIIGPLAAQNLTTNELYADDPFIGGTAYYGLPGYWTNLIDSNDKYLVIPYYQRYSNDEPGIQDREAGIILVEVDDSGTPLPPTYIKFWDDLHVSMTASYEDEDIEFYDLESVNIVYNEEEDIFYYIVIHQGDYGGQRIFVKSFRLTDDGMVQDNCENVTDEFISWWGDTGMGWLDGRFCFWNPADQYDYDGFVHCLPDSTFNFIIGRQIVKAYQREGTN